jgi:hypothetical protein
MPGNKATVALAVTMWKCRSDLWIQITEGQGSVNICYRYLLPNVVVATPLKIFLCIWREKLSNSEKLICTRINAIGYWLNRHGSWQHQLPKYWVNVYWPKMCVFAGLGGGGRESINVRVHVTLFPPHKKLEQSGFCQTRRDNRLNFRVGRKVTIFIGGVVLPVLFAFFASGRCTVNSCVLYCQVAHAYL